MELNWKCVERVCIPEELLAQVEQLAEEASVAREQMIATLLEEAVEARRLDALPQD
jgi:metal-responsive CopG/Arc/MetJ family transcriptional regulator